MMFTLKQLRTIKGLTQTECAKLVGVPLRTYQNYEMYYLEERQI